MNPPSQTLQARRYKNLCVGVGIAVFVLCAGFGCWYLAQRVLRSTVPRTFASVPESAIPGRYKWTEKGKESFIILYTNHTFRNKDGTTFKMYKWQLETNELWIQWSSGRTRFTNIVKEGVYSTVKPDGTPVRLEKVAGWVPPSPGDDKVN